MSYTPQLGGNSLGKTNAIFGDSVPQGYDELIQASIATKKELGFFRPVLSMLCYPREVNVLCKGRGRTFVGHDVVPDIGAVGGVGALAERRKNQEWRLSRLSSLVPVSLQDEAFTDTGGVMG